MKIKNVLNVMMKKEEAYIVKNAVKDVIFPKVMITFQQDAKDVMKDA